MTEVNLPFDGEIIAKHSGKSSAREWCNEHSMWLHPGDFLLRDELGRVWHIHARMVG